MTSSNKLTSELKWAELHCITDRLLNGHQRPEDVQRLEQLLLGNADAQDYFLDACQTHNLINLSVHASRAIDRIQGLTESSPIVRPVIGWQLVGNRIPKTFAVAASILLAFVAGLSLLNDKIGDAPGSSAISDANPGIEPSQPPFRQFAFDFGSETEELKLNDYGTAILQGPGRAEWISPNQIKLHRGRMRVRIDHPHGSTFSLETPGTAVRDVGRDFAVDVSDDQTSTVVVFEGSADLDIRNGSNFSPSQPKRLQGGEGLFVNAKGNVERLMAIVTGSNPTFANISEYVNQNPAPLILDVRDNLLALESQRFYEIVPGGLWEDAKAYVDRPGHEWNGIDERGIPQYLLGANYIKTYNGDKRRRHVQIEVTLSRPAKLFIFFDARIPSPEWLIKDFFETGDKVGLDMGQFFGPDGRLIVKETSAIGPGVSIDAEFSVWVRSVEQPGVVQLGSSAAQTGLSAMYGIAVTELDNVSGLMVR